jgi:hypothetical protein
VQYWAPRITTCSAVECSAQVVVEEERIGAVDSARRFDPVPSMESCVVHDAEHAAARGLTAIAEIPQSRSSRVRRGTRHDVWRSPAAERPVTVPRHREIPLGTARARAVSLLAICASASRWVWTALRMRSRWVSVRWIVV